MYQLRITNYQSMKLRSIRQLKNLKNKRLLVRVDFNVAAVGGKVPRSEWGKIEATLPTIEWLRKRGAITVFITHLGRPAGKRVAALSTRALVQPLSRLAKQPVFFVAETVGPRAIAMVGRAKPGSLLLLENLRFHAGEEKNRAAFARQLAALGDFYVNDAFAVSHRKHASVVAITKYLRSYAGLLLESEVAHLARLLRPEHPFVMVMGGAKISTKIPVIHQLLPRADVILLGGALASTVWKARGYGIGNSLIDEHSFTKILRIARSPKVMLPIDVVIGRPGRKETKIVLIPQKPSPLHHLPFAILDIGPETIERFRTVIHHAQTIMWNGPLGLCEDRRFSKGTRAIAGAVIARSRGRAFGVVGGGDTIPFVRALAGSDAIDFISTGGGAMLEYLSGKTLPGILPLISH